ncbi:fumarylacetoacetate hydrolase family protein [Paraburkholderia sp. J67]|uniref:fumarylacetoacetate hydrolase family protein n=1 Tax=Paraburkholderia sp. J67 TaxID=2805435 RepID=UPI002ABD980E|nr:fumarylacetoacetate hydrolase family protein [Paraburkholderia sp. J67]
MKLVSFTQKGESGWGALTDAGIFDIRQLSGGEWPTLRDALAVQAVSQLNLLVDAGPPTCQLRDVVLQPVIPDSVKILCAEFCESDSAGSQRFPLTSRRDVCIRLPGTLVGHGGPIVRPADTDQFEVRGRLAVVIGRAGRRIPRELARDYVAGYAPFCDTSVMEWRRPDRPSTIAMNFPMTCGMGPWMSTRDASGSETDLHLTTRVNGAEIDFQSASDLRRDIADTIAFCSAFTPLAPGDILVVGGRLRAGLEGGEIYLSPGDSIEVDVATVGTLYHPVIDEVR